PPPQRGDNSRTINARNITDPASAAAAAVLPDGRQRSLQFPRRLPGQRPESPEIRLCCLGDTLGEKKSSSNKPMAAPSPRLSRKFPSLPILFLHHTQKCSRSQK